MDCKTVKSRFGAGDQAQPPETPLLEPGTGAAKSLQCFRASVSPPERGSGHTNLPRLVCCEEHRITLLREESGAFHLRRSRLTAHIQRTCGDLPKHSLTSVFHPSLLRPGARADYTAAWPRGGKTGFT